MNEMVVGYAMNTLSHSDKLRVEQHLAQHPEMQAELDRIRAVLAQLSLDHDSISPPSGLSLRTIIHTAEYAVAHQLLTADPSADTRDDIPIYSEKASEATAAVMQAPHSAPLRSPSSGSYRPVRNWSFRPRWLDVCVAASVGVLAVGLVLTLVQKLQVDRQRIACKENLRVLHGGLSEYASMHDGRYPQIGKDAPTAGAFVQVLANSGTYPVSYTIICPAATPSPVQLVNYRPEVKGTIPHEIIAQVGYVYTLGFRGQDGQLYGYRANDPAISADLTPIVADLPTPAASPNSGPYSPHNIGQNVLYAGGHVMFVTRPTVGPEGDDIYCNDLRYVRAGLHAQDVSLGRAQDLP